MTFLACDIEEFSFIETCPMQLGKEFYSIDM